MLSNKNFLLSSNSDSLCDGVPVFATVTPFPRNNLPCVLGSLPLPLPHARDLLPKGCGVEAPVFATDGIFLPLPITLRLIRNGDRLRALPFDAGELLLSVELELALPADTEAFLL